MVRLFNLLLVCVNSSAHAVSDLADFVSSTENRARIESTIQPSVYLRAGERFLCGV